MKAGRNDPCPCGSGKKLKKCCPGKTHPDQTESSPIEITAQPAAEHKPNSVLLEAHINLGNALLDLGQTNEAVASYCRALDIAPDSAIAYCNLGNALRNLGQLDDAASCCRQALEIDPSLAMAHSNLGNALKDLGQLDDAAACYRRALEISPDFATAHSNLGSTLKDLGQIDDAIKSHRRALKISPDFTMAHYNLGNALHDIGQLDEAVNCYLRALELDPGLADAHNNLGNVLKDLGRLDEAVASYQRAKEVDPNFIMAHSNLLFIHNYQLDQVATKLIAEAQRFGTLVAQHATPNINWHNPPDPDRRLRVGLVSGDFCAHPVGYFIEGILTAISSSASSTLELIGYPNQILTDAVTERIKACCQEWYPIAGLSDESLALKIRGDNIDLLIDLSGHTARNRLPMFAWKPAPVQISWLGYFATTGVATIDYLIADPWVLPESEEVNFTEKIWRLPETRLCFTPPNIKMAVSPLPALSNGYITFGCFNNLSKMNDEVVRVWARVLSAVPDSRLILKANQLGEPRVQQETLARFSAHGISSERLTLDGFESREKYFASYHQVDISLDPFPFPGGTTSVEGLWMGVPLLTLAGERFLPRQGVGILANAGIPEWIATDMDDYVTRAVAHTQDLQSLSDLRGRLRQQVLTSPLFDAPRFAKNLEVALRGMWQRWCDQPE